MQVTRTSVSRAAARPRADKRALDQPHGKPLSSGEKRGPEAHDATARDDEVHGRLTGGLPAIIGICHG